MTAELIAYQYQRAEGWTLEPADAHRDWMHATIGKAALRCLPLAIVNQAGWVIRSPATFKARWKGRKPEPSSLELAFKDKQDQTYAGAIKSNFGSGIITFALPWLFRTSPGIGLWVHGPANDVRSDAVALEGLVETDWSPAPFTMNWKIHKPNVDVWFKRGEVICTITPYPIGLLEQIEPGFKRIEEDPELHAAFLEAARARMQAHATGAPGKGQFELSYIKAGGKVPDGIEHRTNLKLKPFPLPEHPG